MQTKVDIEVFIYKQDGEFVAYCPSLDLVATDTTKSKAFVAFKETLQLYLDSCVRHGTLEKDLIAHGWRTTPASVTPPQISKIVKKPEIRRLHENSIDYDLRHISRTTHAFA